MSDDLPSFALFSEQPGNDVAAMFAILVGAMIAAGGGLGGGGVFVPIYILILNYPPKYAAALSQATIFGGSIVNLIMNLKKHHPTRPHRPIIDFSTLLIFEPMLLVGTIIGVLFNVMFPDILILILLAMVLSYATLRTTRKGIRLWKKETNDLKNNTADDTEKDGRSNVEMQSVEKHKESNDIENGTNDYTEKLKKPSTINEEAKQQGNEDEINGQTHDMEDDEEHKNGDISHPEQHTNSSLSSPNNQNKEKIRLQSVSVVSVDGEVEHEKICKLAKGCGVEPSQITSDKIEACQEFIDRESQMWQPMGYIAIIWFAVSLFAILRRGTVKECSAGYWVLFFFPIPIMMAVSYYMTKKEYEMYQNKINSGCWVAAIGDIELTGSFAKILKYPAVASIAGVLGGLLGIGGGMIVSPLLIELGVIPTVAAATSAMAVLITSSSAMLQFLLLGFLRWDYTIFFMIIGVIGTYVGQTAVNYAVKEYGRVSVVIFAVAIIMGLAIFLMMINGIINLVDGVRWDFHAPC